MWAYLFLKNQSPEDSLYCFASLLQLNITRRLSFSLINLQATMYPNQSYPSAGLPPAMGVPSAFQMQQGPHLWSTGLCDCTTDCWSCCMTCFCPCITFGQIAEIVDQGATFSLVCHHGPKHGYFGLPPWAEVQLFWFATAGQSAVILVCHRGLKHKYAGLLLWAEVQLS
ncbi:uncharacterized protein LOC120103770 isoform X4 [Phoenix dactylifera]|uniref:Uncharacterized protein LOC120103770 isoform X4 n=1 Tax=Phoenix dactylifera TaxID=42345 RepID=A0A8B9AHN4_PHODC|nr:uncharacterized protein LOC120103770 isoform X4 [Phoenix dactylifera]